MRNTLTIAAALAFVAAGAVAQTPPAKDGPQNSAVNTQNSSNRMADGPVKGANSFTEGEAKSRIENKGFASVTELKKDDNGIWRGHAMKNGQRVNVALDYQGNVFEGSGSSVPGSNTARGGAGR